MLVIPLKVAKHVDIASPLLSWLIHQEAQGEAHMSPPISSAEGEHHVLLSATNQNLSADKVNSLTRKSSNEGMKANSNNKFSYNKSSPDNTHGSLPSSQEAEEGLIHLSSMCRSLALAIGTQKQKASPDMESTEKLLKSSMEYHAALLECENRGFPTVDDSVVDLHLEWSCAFEEDREVCSTNTLRCGM